MDMDEIEPTRFPSACAQVVLSAIEDITLCLAGISLRTAFGISEEIFFYQS